MFPKKSGRVVACTASLLFLIVFGSQALAKPGLVSGSSSEIAGIQVAQSSLMGSDSKGSYAHGSEKKAEGSKSKMMPPAGTMHGKSGSGMSKGYSRGHGFTHKKQEGSKTKSYSKGHGTSQGKGYAHKKREGSGGGYSGHGSARGGHGYGKSTHGSGGHSYGHSRKINPFKHVLRFKEKLGLTEAQVQRINDLSFEFKKMKIQSKADHTIAHMELDRLVHSGTLDEGKMRALADRISAIKSKKIHALVEGKIALLKILTPEQRKKVSKMHSGH